MDVHIFEEIIEVYHTMYILSLLYFMPSFLLNKKNDLKVMSHYIFSWVKVDDKMEKSIVSKKKYIQIFYVFIKLTQLRMY